MIVHYFARKKCISEIVLKTNFQAFFDLPCLPAGRGLPAIYYGEFASWQNCVYPNSNISKIDISWPHYSKA
jgi:hypothetical protein